MSVPAMTPAGRGDPPVAGAADAGVAPAGRRRIARIELVIARLMLILSAGLCFFLSLCFYFWFEPCAAITIAPPWIWLIPGVLLAGLGWRGFRRRYVAAVLLLWLAYLLVFSEEPRSLVSGRRQPSPQWLAARARGAALRVVSLNCASVGRKATSEIAPLGPDLVMLQESPSRSDTEAIAAEFFGEAGGVAWDVDTVIIARGRVEQRAVPESLRGYVTHASVQLESGLTLDVINLRLAPSFVSLDLWSPKVWRRQTDCRRRRCAQGQALADMIAAVRADTPLIVGGDFNAPAGEPLYDLLRPRLRDSFADGGVGWCNTITNEFPVLRIDQIWTSEHLRCDALVARRTQESDHRMVVCDLAVVGR